MRQVSEAWVNGSDECESGSTDLKLRSRRSLGKQNSREADTPRRAASSMDIQRAIPLLRTTMLSFSSGDIGGEQMLSPSAPSRRCCEQLVMSRRVGMPGTIPELAGQTSRNYGM
jgi:hypothetical protein